MALAQRVDAILNLVRLRHQSLAHAGKRGGAGLQHGAHLAAQVGDFLVVQRLEMETLFVFPLDHLDEAVDPVGGLLEFGNHAQHRGDARCVVAADLVGRALDQIGGDVVQHDVAGVLHALQLDDFRGLIDIRLFEHFDKSPKHLVGEIGHAPGGTLGLGDVEFAEIHQVLGDIL
jgi:hypothetical protein